MRRAGISSARRRAYRVTTNSNHVYAPAPNLLRRQFDIAEPNTAWVGDITYIPTGEGWLYAAVVKDLCTKKVVGYAFSNRIDTALTVSALEMAVRRERPAAGLIFHSDRGVQYAAQAYRDALARHNIRQSMSRRGDPYDNAVAENFFSCLKCELVISELFPDPCGSTGCGALITYSATLQNTVIHSAFLSFFVSVFSRRGHNFILQFTIQYISSIFPATDCQKNPLDNHTLEQPPGHRL